MHSLRTKVVKIVAISLIASTTVFAGAGKPHPASSFQIGPTSGQVVGALVGIAGVGAAIGIGVYYAARHHRNLTGCASSGPDGLQLENEGDRKTYALSGDLAAVKPGDRIRVRGEKEKGGGGVQPFLVEKVSRDFGACKVHPATR